MLNYAYFGIILRASSLIKLIVTAYNVSWFGQQPHNGLVTVTQR